MTTERDAIRAVAAQYQEVVAEFGGEANALEAVQLQARALVEQGYTIRGVFPFPDDAKAAWVIFAAAALRELSESLASVREAAQRAVRAYRENQENNSVDADSPMLDLEEVLAQLPKESE